MKKRKNALILVDLQNDFFPGGALPVSKGNEIIPIINKLVSYPFDHVLATKDWHPPTHGSFAKTHAKQPGERIKLAGLEQILWPVHCIQETKGAEFSPGWDARNVEKIFYKGTDPLVDSYSTFFDNGHIKSTGLADYLHSKNVKDVYIAGLATDYCVKYSVLDALELGFKVYVVVDGCRGVDLKEGDSRRAMEEVHQKGAEMLSSVKVLEKLEDSLIESRGGGI